jgi:anti-sigma regulatory factor (Ser/Thr protein kinase)
MSTVNEPYNILILKRRVVLAILSLATIGATISTVVHRLQPNPHLVNLIAPPLLASVCLILLIRLYKKPESLQQVIHLGLLGAVLFVVVPSWFFTLKAIASSSTTLVDSLPPLTSALFVLTMVMLIALRRHQRLVIASIIAWMAIAAPILTYLLLHPPELLTSRGFDLFISLGPTLGIQIVLIVFYNRLQDMVERLYTERLQYYAQIIERQAIRQQAMEQAFTQIHNGPLQTLALLLRDVQLDQTPSPQLFQRLNDLNAEIRAVGRSLTDAAHPEQKSAADLATLETATFEQILRLGEGTCIDLNRPLHNLLHEVYAITLKRNLPYFQTIQVKVRNFAPLEQPTLTQEMKRDLCLWLEEALCNVGKHAQGTTRIVVTGQHHEGQYVLKVQDNGAGLKPGQGQGTKHCNLLAQRLGGQFRRESLSKGGVICELSWLVES